MSLTDAISGWVNPLFRIARALERIAVTQERAYPQRRLPETPSAVIVDTPDADFARWEDQSQQRQSEGLDNRD